MEVAVMRNWGSLASSILVALIALPAGGQPTFRQSCPNPSYPSAQPTPIDSECGVEGKGGAEVKQNEAKNNFCASGSEAITIAQMADLQKHVDQDKNIPFGNSDLHPLTSSPGPATDRSPLQKLGEGNEVVLTGFVKVARQEGAESVNCGKGASSPVPDQPENHDVHISIVTTTGKAECSGVVVEMIPHHRPTSWTPDLVNQVAKAQRPVRVTGQLMFDSSHTPCISGKAVKGDPARVSLWEVHPIYKFEVCGQGNCTSNTGWVPLESWKQ
jgi:hypothetical protein